MEVRGHPSYYPLDRDLPDLMRPMYLGVRGCPILPWQVLVGSPPRIHPHTYGTQKSAEKRKNKPTMANVIGVEVLVSIATGVLLWAFLPRGVVLTRAVKTENRTGEPLDDTWELKNDSPLSLTLTSVRLAMPGYERDLPWDGEHGVRLCFDDETAEIAREDFQRPWNEVVVEPGDTLEAAMQSNTSLLIEYRRAGWLGVFERRRVVIHGHV